MSHSSSTTRSTRTPGFSAWWTWPWATRGSSPGTRSITYNRWRPITAIQDANQDGNPATVADPKWTPLGSPGDGVRANFTPSFPSYVSGHAAFGGALFTTLADFYGTDNMTFTIGSDEEPGVYYTFNSFSAASDQNGMSRIYLGIHFIFDETAGITEGDAIGNYDYQHVMTLND